MSQARFYNVIGERLIIIEKESTNIAIQMKFMWERMEKISQEAHEAIKLFISSTTNTEEK